MTNDRRVTGLRRRMSEIENDLIDELPSGRIDRREFLRHGSVLGLGMPLLSPWPGRWASRAWGPRPSRRPPGPPSPAAPSASPPRCRRAPSIPSPWPMPAACMMLQQTGEFLAISGPDLGSARCWPRAGSPIRTARSGPSRSAKGVKFHNGNDDDGR